MSWSCAAGVEKVKSIFLSPFKSRSNCPSTMPQATWLPAGTHFINGATMVSGKKSFDTVRLLASTTGIEFLCKLELSFLQEISENIIIAARRKSGFLIVLENFGITRAQPGIVKIVSY